MKKENTILIGLSALLAAFVAGYFLTRPDGGAGTLANQRADILDRFADNTDAASQTTASVPIPDGLFKISDDSALSAVADPSSDDVLYYHTGTGFVSRISIAGQQSLTLSSTELPRLQKVIWSPDKKSVVTVFATTRGNRYEYYNYTTKTHGVFAK